jgi:predicted Co/Zn/Cd cation transporter (cation efflux family)
MLGSASPETQTKIQGLINETINKYPYAKYALRMAEVGQSLYLHFYWLLPTDKTMISLAELDQMRSNLIETIQQEYPNMIMDIIFTQDQVWFTQMNDQRGIQSITNNN